MLDRNRPTSGTPLRIDKYRPPTWLSPQRLLMTVLAIFAMTWMSSAFAQNHQHGAATAEAATPTTTAAPANADKAAASTGVPMATASVSYHNPTTFTLRTGIATGRMVYIGVFLLDRRTSPGWHGRPDPGHGGPKGGHGIGSRRHCAGSR